MVKSGQRINYATKIALLSDIRRITYTVHLTAFFHQWAMIVIGILIPSASTVLQFLAALNRAGTAGYAGCAVAYKLLAPQIAIATGRPCSVTTLERGIRFLKRVGLVSLTWWTMPARTIQNGPYQHRIPGTARVETDTGWTSRQIRIVVLTPRAIALWDAATSKKGSDIIPHFRPFITPVKMEDSSQDDQVGKPTMIQPTSSLSDTSTCDSDKDNIQGTTTRPLGSNMETSTTATIGTSPNLVGPNRAPTPVPVSSQNAENQNGLEKLETKKEQNSRQSPMGSIPAPTLASISSPRGCSYTPPPMPKNAPVKTTWPVARAYLLIELHRCLSKFSRRQANVIYRRAEDELTVPRNGFTWPTVVDWPYWIARFGNFSPNQRHHHMVRDILPLLKSTTPAIPDEPLKRLPNDPTRHGKRKLEPFLAQLARRLALKIEDDD